MKKGKEDEKVDIHFGLCVALLMVGIATGPLKNERRIFPPLQSNPKRKEKEMKRLMLPLIVVGVLLVSGLSNAQTKLTGKPVNTDGTVFTVTQVKEKSNGMGGSILVTNVITVGGDGSHADLTVDDTTGAPISLDIYLLPPKATGLQWIMSCDRFRGISAHHNIPTPPAYSEPIRAIFTCSFNPHGIVGDETIDGVGYIDFSGTLWGTNVSEVPTKIKVSSSKMAGVYFEDPGDKLEVHGNFMVTLK